MCHLEENSAKYLPIDFGFFQKITFRIRMFYLKQDYVAQNRYCQKVYIFAISHNRSSWADVPRAGVHPPCGRATFASSCILYDEADWVALMVLSY